MLIVKNKGLQVNISIAKIVKIAVLFMLLIIVTFGSLKSFASASLNNSSHVCYGYISTDDYSPSVPKIIFNTNQDHIRDLSMWLVASIFGMENEETQEQFYSIYSNEQENNNNFITQRGYISKEGTYVFGSIFKVFNKVVLVAGLMLLIFNVFFLILEAATKGELGENYFLPFFFRILISILVLLPVNNDIDSTDSGYTYGQRAFMWLVGQGVGAANSVYTAGLCALVYSSDAQLKTGATPSSNSSDQSKHNYVSNLVKNGWMYAGFFYQEIFKSSISNFTAINNLEEDIEVDVSFEEVNSWIGNLQRGVTTHSWDRVNQEHRPLSQKYHMMQGGRSSVNFRAYNYHTEGIMPLMGVDYGNSLGLMVMCKLQREHLRLPVIYRYHDGYAFNPNFNNGYEAPYRGIKYKTNIIPGMLYEINIGTIESNENDYCGSIKLNIDAFKDYDNNTLDDVTRLISNYIENELDEILQSYLIWPSSSPSNNLNSNNSFNEFYNLYVREQQTCNDSRCLIDDAPYQYETSKNIKQSWRTSLGGFTVKDVDSLYDLQTQLIISTFDLLTEFKTILNIEKGDDAYSFSHYFDLTTKFNTIGPLENHEPYLASQYFEKFSYGLNTAETKEYMDADTVLSLYKNSGKEFRELEEQNSNSNSNSMFSNNLSSESNNNYLLASSNLDIGPIKASEANIGYVNSPGFSSGGNQFFSFGFVELFEGFMQDMGELQKGGSRSAPEIMAKNGEKMMNTASTVLITFFGLQVGIAFATMACFGRSPAGAAAQSVYNSISPTLTAMVGFFWLQGSVLGVVIPMVPILIWLVAICGWLFFVIEGMIAINLVAMGLLWPNTQNHFLARAEPSIMLLLNIFLRPSLNIMGLFGALIACNFAVGFFTAGFFMAYDKTIYIEPTFGWMAAMTGLVGIYFIIIKMSYSMIHILPDKVLVWISGRDAGLPKPDDLVDSFKGGAEIGASQSNQLMMKTHQAARTFADATYEKYQGDK